MDQIKERPILFSGEMVRAILEGRKTQTRRVIKKLPQFVDEVARKIVPFNGTGEELKYYIKCPFGKPGDRLWVRETFSASTHHSCGECGCECMDFKICYQADGKTNIFNGYDSRFDDWSFDHGRRYPSIHMPRWASRINLLITKVGVERMQDGGDRDFWGEEKWQQNPWVWVIEFERVK